jgi:Tfp pilus assembly protein PilX
MRKTQTGMSTLTMAIVLLVAMTSIAMYGTKTAKNEVIASANETRTSHAFESAEAGLEYARAYINANTLSALTDADNDGYIDPIADASLTSGTLENSDLYAFTFTNPTPNDFNTILISSTGTSSDGSTTRTVSQLYSIQTALAGTGPQAGFIARNDVTLGGSVSIANPDTPYSIWSGGTVGLSGAASTGNGDGDSSNQHSKGNDIVDEDSNLASLSDAQFFDLFFTGSPDEIRNMATSYYSNTTDTNYNSDLSGKAGEIIWIDQTSGEARLNSNITIGSPTEPVILVINGDLHINGNTTIYGVVYVMNDWNNSGGGTLDITGAAIVEGNFSGTGTPNITYDAGIVGDVADNFGSYAAVPGSWRDF